MRQMQDSAMSHIAEKAGGRLPILRGKDPGLPKLPPTFDPDALRAKNVEALRLRVIKGRKE